MFKLKKASIAGACALGLTAGAFAMAGPAAAVTYSAGYNCVGSASYPAIGAEFDINGSGLLRIQAESPVATPGPPATAVWISADLSFSYTGTTITHVHGTVPPGTPVGGIILLQKSSVTWPAPPVTTPVTPGSPSVLTLKIYTSSAETTLLDTVTCTRI